VQNLFIFKIFQDYAEMELSKLVQVFKPISRTFKYLIENNTENFS